MASKTSFPYEVVMNLKEIRSDMSHPCPAKYFSDHRMELVLWA